MNGNTLNVRAGLPKNFPSHWLSREYASSVADRGDSTKLSQAVRHETPARSVSNRSRARPSRARVMLEPRASSQISKNSTFVKIDGIVRFSKKSISVPKIQTCWTPRPLSTFCVRGQADFFQSARHQMCTGTRFFSPQTHTFSGLPTFAKSCPRKARSDRAARNLRRSAWRVTGGGSVGSHPWVSERGCREFQPAPVQAASRSCRNAYIARDPQFPPIPHSK